MNQVYEMRIFVNKWRIIEYDILTIIILINSVIKTRINIKINIMIIWLRNKCVLTRIVCLIKNVVDDS